MHLKVDPVAKDTMNTAELHKKKKEKFLRNSLSYDLISAWIFAALRLPTGAELLEIVVRRRGNAPSGTIDVEGSVSIILPDYDIAMDYGPELVI